MNHLGDGASFSSASNQTTLSEVVRQRASTDPERIAYTFLADGDTDVHNMTWSQLNRQANALGVSLQQQGAAGQPVLLMLPSGLSFVVALFACWFAGAIAVPVSLPRHQRVKHRLDRIVADAGARFAVGSADTRQRLAGDNADSDWTRGLTWIDPDIASHASSEIDLTAGVSSSLTVAGEGVAVLQYTSGSTGSPRGVIVTHSNLMHNSAVIREACGHGSNDTIAGWLPLFHDMGLVGLVIQGAYSGARCVFMPPERFLMRPWLWLRMITDYGVCSSPAPNFAYDLCVDKVTDDRKAGLDLSGWQHALNGSEPIRAATLDRFAAAFASCGFSPKAFFPCYGLAEATLLVTAPDKSKKTTRRTAAGVALPPGETRGHVGCGLTFGDTRIAVVDPQSLARVPAGAIGEIWVAGGSCAKGYWNNPDATAATFNARLNTVPQSDSAIDDPADQSWLRTGDLGFIADNELFITGRLRELIIIAGRNHFPVDLERTVELADPVIAASAVAAFSTDITGIERLIIVAEVRREFAKSGKLGSPDAIDAQAITRRIFGAVAAEHEVTPHDFVLLRPGALPRTTSGKLSRRTTRDMYLDQTLERLETSTYVHADA